MSTIGNDRHDCHHLGSHPLDYAELTPLGLLINPLLRQSQPVFLRLLRCVKISAWDSLQLNDRAELTGNTDDAYRFGAGHKKGDSGTAQVAPLCTRRSFEPYTEKYFQ